MEKIFNDFCKSKECTEYIEVSMEGGTCICCKKIGMSYDIEEYPNDCNFLEDIISFENDTSN